LKSQLYHHAVRNLTSALKQNLEQPVPVSAKTKPNREQTELKQKEDLLNQFLNVLRVAENDDGTFELPGVNTGKTKLETVRKHILHPYKIMTKIPNGFKEIADEMDIRGMPRDFFKVKSQKGLGLRKKLSKNVKKNTKPKQTKTFWKSY